VATRRGWRAPRRPSHEHQLYGIRAGSAMSAATVSWSLAQAPSVQPQCVAALVGLANHAGVLVRGVDVLGVVHVPAGCRLRSCRGAVELAKEVAPQRDKTDGNGPDRGWGGAPVWTRALPLAERHSRCAAADRAGGRGCEGWRDAVQIFGRPGLCGNARWLHVRAASVACGRCRGAATLTAGVVTAWPCRLPSAGCSGVCVAGAW
jgi:hypothetical protein